MNNLLEKIKNIPTHIKILICILIGSFLVKFYFVFAVSDYQNYLYSDMKGYWARALQRYTSGSNPVGQTIIWPPVYHYYLAGLFSILSYIGLFEKKLEIILVFNIVFSTASVLFVYLISKQFLSTHFSLIVSVFYAFTYPLIYINAFVMSEPTCLFLLLAAIYLLLTYTDRKLILFLAGILFGYAVGIRPSIGLLGLSCAGYIFFTGGKNIKSFSRTVIFLTGFFIIVLSISVENYNVSQGRLKGLSAHGGANFLLRQCRVGKIICKVTDGMYVLSPPVFNAYPELRQIETVRTRMPFYNQKYFYKKGIECIMEKPLETLGGNFLLFKTLFWGPFFPGRSDVYGYDTFMSIFNTMIFFMFISLGLLFIPFKKGLLPRSKNIFLLSIICWILFTCYLFSTGQRQ